MSVEHLEVIRFAEVTDMLDRCVLMWGGLMVNVFVAQAQPYDFANANALLEAERLNLDGHVAVLIRQDGTEVFRRRFQLGDIDFDTQVRMASFTKTVSAGVVLSLVEDGVLALDERLGDALPAYQAGGIGDPTFLDCWSMRHGIETPGEYHRSALLTLEQSIAAIGLQGFTVFTPPGSQLGYDGVGQHSVGAVGVFRTGLDWESLAQARIFGPCAMVNSDYQQFAPNPAIAGGLRSTANDTIQYAQMIIDRGWFDGERVLNEASIARLFTNETRGLPVYHSPWPPTHPLYPYGCDPDYAFGAWVLAENPQTAHVEEIIGAGAWGSYIWIDRRRALTGVLITDVPAGSQSSTDAALGIFDIARREIDSAQAGRLRAVQLGGDVCLSWNPAPGSSATRIHGADAPIRDIFDLREAVPLGQTTSANATVPPYDFYAVTAEFDAFHNPALSPARNALAAPTWRPDLDGDGAVDLRDLATLVNDMGNAGPAAPSDVDGDGDTDLADFAIMQRYYGSADCG
jgi:CubicO group peptidase (beta-lactamase class C family)